MGTSSSTVASIPRIHFSTICLLLANLLVYQIAFLHGHASISARNTQHGDFNPIAFEHRPRISPLVLNHSHAIPIGHAIALPSIRVDNATDRAGGYGGEGDKPHLGGFVEVDMHGISPGTWTFLLETIGVKSIIDVGCGRGISTSWFLMHGVDALCVEGSHDAREKTMLPDPENQMVEHDFARGPWWPDKTYDAVWCVEFLEHVGRNFHKNYIATFRKAALIFVTHSTWGGWHHVEVHDADWWISKFELYGFVYSPLLTESVRDAARSDKNVTTIRGARNQMFNAQHIWLHMLVFINPEVGSLSEHAHLMAEMGCYDSKKTDNSGKRTLIHRECSSGPRNEHETKLPDSFKPIQIEEPERKLREWETWVNNHLSL